MAGGPEVARVGALREFPALAQPARTLGAKRIARHLWRMCFGLFIAAGSFFFGPSNHPLTLLSTVGIGKYLSPALFGTTLYLVLTLLPLILLVFWLVRVRFTNAYNGKPMIPGELARIAEQKPAP